MSRVLTLGSASVATPVLEWLASAPNRGGQVVWAGPSGAYLRFDGFVLAVTAIGVGRMPNGVALNDALPTSVRAGLPVRVRPDVLEVGDVLSVRLEGEPWEPRPSTLIDGRVLAERGASILRALGLRTAAPAERVAAIARRSGLGDHREALDGSAALLRWLDLEGEDDARLASARLIGRGPGLTPVGDDLLAGVGFARVSVGSDPRGLGALCPPDVELRTNALGATLLRLAVQGRAIEAAARLINPRSDLRDALARLRRFGRTTGSAYALGIGIALAPGWGYRDGSAVGSRDRLDESPSSGLAGHLAVLHDDPAA